MYNHTIFDHSCSFTTSRQHHRRTICYYDIAYSILFHLSHLLLTFRYRASQLSPTFSNSNIYVVMTLGGSNCVRQVNLAISALTQISTTFFVWKRWFWHGPRMLIFEKILSTNIRVTPKAGIPCTSTFCEYWGRTVYVLNYLDFDLVGVTLPPAAAAFFCAMCVW